MVRLFGKSSLGKIEPISTEERTYTRRQRLTRTISSHTLTLIQTWFDILPKDDEGKVFVVLLIQRISRFLSWGISSTEKKISHSKCDGYAQGIYRRRSTKSGWGEGSSSTAGHLSQRDSAVVLFREICSNPKSVESKGDGIPSLRETVNHSPPLMPPRPLFLS